LLYKLSLRQRKDIEREVPFPDDVQVILRGDSLEKGNLFIGNIEAANNVQLLQSTIFDIL